MKISIRKIAFAAVVAAAYAALTIVLAPISFGPLQLRVSEVLCILPFFFPSSAWGLFVGCVIANMFSIYGVIDVIFGSAATLVSGFCVIWLGKRSEGIISKILACFSPAVFNALFVGGVIAYSVAEDAFWSVYVFSGAEIFLSELAVLLILGLPIMLNIHKTRLYKELQNIYNSK